MTIKNLLKRSAFALCFLMGFTLSSYAQGNNQDQNNQSGIDLRRLRSDGNKSSDLSYERLGDLCDSLQLALNLPIREVLPVQRNGDKSNKRLNEKELRLTLTEIFIALGFEVNLPTRFTPGNLDVIFYSIIGPPSMTITSTEVADGGATFEGSIGLTFTSTKETSDFTEADIAMTNGTLSGFTGSGKTYTATFTPDDEGTCTVSIAEASFSDENGKANVAAIEFVWTHDTTSPTVAIASVEVTNGAITSDASLSFTFTTSESTSSFDETVIAVTNGTLSSFAGSGTNYSATFIPDAVGVCTIQVLDDAFTDLAGNGNTVSEEFIWTHAFAPTVDTYDELNSNAGYWAQLSASFTDGGSEVTMTGFLYSTNPDFLTTMSFGNELTSPFSGSLSFLSGSTQYWVAAFAENAIGRGYGDTITVTSLPRMAITAAEVADGGITSSPTLSLTFTASESTTDFDETDITVGNGLAVLDGTLTEFTGSGTTYTATFTQVGYYNYAINVGQGAFPGPSGNLYTAAPEFNWTYASSPTVDTEDPTTVTDLTATLNGTFTKNGSNVTATGFKYGTDAQLSSPTDVPGNGTTSPFNGTLSGLTHSTQYWAVSYATNAMGTSYGDTISFTTLVTPAVFINCGDEIYYDGYNYATVPIGNQCWFAENLRNDDYNDETPIAGNLDNAAWQGTNEGAQTILDQGGANEASNLSTYGRLYNWYAVSTGKLCPSGWYVPADEEWTTLTNYLGGENVAGVKMRSSASDVPSWDGTNESGFSGLPGGVRYSNGTYSGGGPEDGGFWWSSTPNNSEAWIRDVYTGYNAAYRSSSYQSWGSSVRCLKMVPPVVETGAASSVSYFSANLSATLVGKEVTATGFKYGTDELLSSPTEVEGDGITSPFTATLSGLTAATQYWAVGFATNPEGTSYGDTVTFTTMEFFNCGTASVTYDEYEYATVSIGSQCWIAENLRNDNYANGTPIPEISDDSEWESNSTGAQVAYEHNADYLTPHGRLYNWHAVTNAAGLCPVGWQVPSDEEWTTLVDFLGGASQAGVKMKAPQDVWDGSNTSGFNGMPSGYRENAGYFDNLGEQGQWWSSTPDSWKAYTRYVFSGYSGVNRVSLPKEDGYSVRCVLTPPLMMTITATEASDGDAWGDAMLSLTFTSPEGTTDFTESDITVTNGAISAFAGSGTTYTATFTATDYGACTINVAGGTYTDANGNSNVASDEFNWNYELLEAPTVETGAPTQVTNLSAILNATVIGTNLTSVGFLYGMDEILSSPTAVQADGGGPWNAELYSLTALTQYWAVAYATNAGGTSYGDTITFTTCGEPAVFNNCGDAISYNCYNYSTVSISGQCWFAENLRSEYYNNGTAIASGLDDSAWSANTEGAVAVNGEGGPNEASNLADYGRLYNWHAVNTGNLCPSGWHVPTSDDWNAMISAAGMWFTAGGKMKSAPPGWDGTNTLQFNGLPGGKRNNWGPFENPGGSECAWWTSSPETVNNAWVRKLISGYMSVNTDYKDKKDGLSVRCIQDLD